MFCPVCHVLVSCSPFAGLYCPVLCGVVCWLYTYNPVEVPTCHGAFVRINIYLSCSLSCCTRCVLSRRFWRSSPRRQRYATEKCDFSLKKTNYKNIIPVSPSPKVHDSHVGWVCMFDVVSVCLGKKPPVDGWLKLSMSQRMNFIVTFTTTFTWRCCLQRRVLDFNVSAHKFKENYTLMGLDVLAQFSLNKWTFSAGTSRMGLSR